MSAGGMSRGGMSRGGMSQGGMSRVGTSRGSMSRGALNGSDVRLPKSGPGKGPRLAGNSGRPGGSRKVLVRQSGEPPPLRGCQHGRQGLPHSGRDREARPLQGQKTSVSAAGKGRSQRRPGPGASGGANRRTPGPEVCRRLPRTARRRQDVQPPALLRPDEPEPVEPCGTRRTRHDRPKRGGRRDAVRHPGCLAGECRGRGGPGVQQIERGQQFGI